MINIIATNILIFAFGEAGNKRMFAGLLYNLKVFSEM
jgi:hypothetical protein